jgi:N utilization substance protein B
MKTPAANSTPPLISPRRKAREIALQILFQLEFTPELTVGSSLMYFREHITAPPEAWEYAEQLLNGVAEFKDKIDGQIRDSSTNWRIDRIASVDLSLLRLAVYEMLFADPAIPFKAAIDESLELAKKYGSTESAGFINGVLDHAHRNAKG